jgi:hypothetical protein
MMARTVVAAIALIWREWISRGLSARAPVGDFDPVLAERNLKVMVFFFNALDGRSRWLPERIRE